MASIMLTAMPFAGHARPVRAVAAELVRRGHDVRVYTGRSYVPLFDAVGARGVPWVQAPEFDERDLAATFPRLRERKGFRQVLVNLQDLFLGTAPAQCEDLLALHDAEPWDLLAGDPMALGTRFAAERLHQEWASVSPVAVWLPGKGIPPTGLGLAPARGPAGRVRDAVLNATTGASSSVLTRLYQRTRRDVGLPPDGESFATMWYSPWLVVGAGSPGLDYPRDDLGEHVRFVGDLTDDGVTAPPPDLPPDLPPWWDDVVHAEVPVVHVTQGTANVDPHDLVLPALEALAGEDVLVVVGTGHRTDPLPGPLPVNARVASMVPYPALLPRTAVMVTNGGFGGVLQALRHDVPLVVAGGDLDKPEIAARVAWHGAGVNLRTGTPRPAAVAAACREVLAVPSYRASAARLGAELRSLGGTRAAADLLEARLP
ncbi:glycosyltransferase [Cellulosimicrobium marinum]|uniref:glycosyltransferase n=1 Tax=Cellulosimicrobium marinum TaxID=1638992 RepID=UPI001E2C79D3|nr:nucleotide disphospho-sugar-binding domain-containing protein [Cellulosimicrobium marinum]MCB7135808.1 glycosyltransferase [Cellulosimicrobium marinum]